MAALARTCLAIVLAAGEGTRMRSATPKVLHPIAGRPMLAHVLTAAATADVTAVAVVIGSDRDDVARLARTTMPDARIFTQVERRGTAHAVLTARAAIAEGYDDILVLYADVPLIEPETLRSMRDAIAGGATVATLGFEADDPSDYGRLIIDHGELVAIREHKDATEAERLLSFCNSGLMAIDGSAALTILEGIDCGNAQGEFYLTDAVEMARRHGGRCVAVPGRAAEVMGVNDRVQLSMVEALWQKRMREVAMRSGVTMLAPETVFLSYDTRLGRDVLIEPHVVFGPGVTVEEGGIVHAFSHLEGARIASGGSVGPYARLRPGADIGAKAKVGNFVEIKNAAVEAGAKISHLSYIGDARVGAGANIGAGTITCNYDGFGKHRTDIGAGAFVGSNSALVAPVSIGDGAFVGSGSVITEDVPADGLALGRARQTNKPDWAARFRSAHKVK